jgi:hypothetical protein
LQAAIDHLSEWHYTMKRRASVPITWRLTG